MKTIFGCFLAGVVGTIGWLLINVSEMHANQMVLQYQVNEIMDTMKKYTDTLTTIHDKLHDQFGW